MQNRHLLLSFCNVHFSQLVLGLIDLHDKHFRWIDLSFVHDRVLGATGIAQSEDTLYILIQLESGRTGLVVFGEYGKKQAFLPLNQVSDGHSIIWYNNGLLVTDTSRNRLVYVKVSDDLSHTFESEYWRLSEAEFDEVHLNSVEAFHGSVYVTMFGRQKKNSWIHSDEGAVLNISTGETVATGLFHPHSLKTINNKLFFLESRRGLCHQMNFDESFSCAISLKGYLRGLAADKGSLYIASSAARRKSKSTGTDNTPVDDDSFPRQSSLFEISTGISRYFRANKFQKFNLHHYGSEVYDLFIPHGDFVLPTISEDAVNFRLFTYENELFLRW